MQFQVSLQVGTDPAQVVQHYTRVRVMGTAVVRLLEDFIMNPLIEILLEFLPPLLRPT